MTVRIGIVGAGAVTEVYHLPAAAACRELDVVALADRNTDRARRLARVFGVPRVTADWRDLLGAVDGVVVALPHHLHCEVGVEFLRAGTPVLMEKPMARTAAEARRMLEGAKAPLQIGHYYRFAKGPRQVRERVRAAPSGSFSLEFGVVYRWPVASGFFFDRDQSGGGVLLDAGSHMIDLLRWWFGELRLKSYRDDSLGGVEADCEAEWSAGRVRGTMTLSRLRKLSCLFRAGGITYDLRTPGEGQTWPEVYADQLRGFARAIQGGPVEASAADAIAGLQLIDDAYARRETLEHPWVRCAAH